LADLESFDPTDAGLCSGQTATAGRWQVWTALLTYVLLRCLSHLSKWAHSFTRLFTILRAALWEKYDLLKLARACPKGAKTQ
jgi:hypothetical protein